MMNQSGKCPSPSRWIDYHQKNAMLSLLLFFMVMIHGSVCAFPETANSDMIPYRSYRALRQRGSFELSQQKSGKPQEIDTTPRPKHTQIQPGSYDRSRIMQAKTDDTNITLFVTPSHAFQTIMSILLSALTLLQLLLFICFYRNRSKRTLEFTQPTVICLFVACSIVTTVSCYLYVHEVSTAACTIREPIVFTSVSLMLATIAGRAWRISVLLNNPLPLSTSWWEGGGNGSSDLSRTERARQFTLRMMTVMSSDCTFGLLGRRRTSLNSSSSTGIDGRPRPIRVQISFFQMIRATISLILPQLIWQMIVIATPALRSSRELVSHSHDFNDQQVVLIEQYQCQSTVGFWPNYVSILLAMLPCIISYLLNIRSKSELDILPDIIDERKPLVQSFSIFARVIAVSAPMMGLTYSNNPEARAYGTICAVLGLPLACCYHIAYSKIESFNSNSNAQKQLKLKRKPGTNGFVSNDATDGRKSAAAAVRLAKMYSRIGRAEETIHLVDDTLRLFQQGTRTSSGGGMFSSVADRVQYDDSQEVALGFKANDLKLLDEDEIQSIIHLVQLKARAIEKLEGFSGYTKSAKLNVGALKIFEFCPATSQIQDISFMFPIYNEVALQMKTGLIHQDDDRFSLEKELAVRFCREAKLQTYHYARSLANLAEICGRMGKPAEALKHFDTMKSVYMKRDHPKLLLHAYSIDRCSVSFSTSALWYLLQGQTDKALEMCDFVIDHVLPHHSVSDINGLYTIICNIIRVLKWNGQVDKARDAYIRFIPDEVESHFGIGNLHQPICLLLQICEGSSFQYRKEQLPKSIEIAISFETNDIQDNYFTCEGWSMKSMAAELCMLLALRLDEGHHDNTRERLIDKGMTMTSEAKQRLMASNGRVKHLLAYEANKEIETKLRKLSNIEMDDEITTEETYDGIEELELGQTGKEGEAASSTFANKFSVKEENFNSSEMSIKSNKSSVPVPSVEANDAGKKMRKKLLNRQKSSFMSTINI